MTELHTFNDPRVLRAIALVWKEAELLDAKDYPAWEALYTDDAHYVIPIDPDTDDFDSSLNMVYDDKRMRRLRVERMMQGYAPSAVAAARTVRVISRFTVSDVNDDTVILRSAQILNAFKRDTFSTIGAITRATWSVDPPAPQGTMMLIGFVGCHCAKAGATARATPIATHAAKPVPAILISSSLDVIASGLPGPFLVGKADASTETLSSDK